MLGMTEAGMARRQRRLRERRNSPRQLRRVSSCSQSFLIFLSPIMRAARATVGLETSAIS